MQWYANRDIIVGLLKRKKREERDFRALEPHCPSANVQQCWHKEVIVLKSTWIKVGATSSIMQI